MKEWVLNGKGEGKMLYTRVNESKLLKDGEGHGCCHFCYLRM